MAEVFTGRPRRRYSIALSPLRVSTVVRGGRTVRSASIVLLVSALSGVLPVVVAPAAIAGPVVASCPTPMVPRRALPDDGVCVEPRSRNRVAAENARAAMLWIPGPYGPKTCANGYVWREATPVDFTCVTPDIRTLVRGEQGNPQLPEGR